MMKGKVCVVTGANSGIGRETVLALAGMGARVVMAVRDRERGEKARAEIVGETGSNEVDLMVCDVSLMSEVRRFAGEFTGNYDRLDVLINNAGAVFYKRQVTPESFERTLALNYLGPFLLTRELLPLLKSSVPSRVISLSSGLHKSGKVDFGDLQSEKDYEGMRAYRSAKLMVLMFTYELARRLEGSGVSVNAVQPGFAATNLGRNSGSRLQSFMFGMMRPFQASAKKAAETSVYLASSKEVEGVTGKCFARMKETATAPASYDQQMQRQLWETTEKLLGLTSSA